MKIHVYAIIRNEASILPYFLRHYEPLAEKIVVFDDNSDDSSREILSRCAKVDIRTPPEPMLDDGMFAEVHSNAYRGDRSADWVMCVDADEFVWSENLKKSLEIDTDVIDLPVFEMASFVFPNTAMQIYDQVRYGTSWADMGLPYPTKPCVFKSTANVRFDCGRHFLVDANGLRISKQHDLKLLHYRNLSYDYYRWHHDRNASRLSPKRRDKTWGQHNLSPMTQNQFDMARIKAKRIIP